MLSTVRLAIASAFLAAASLPASAGVVTLTATQDAGLRGDLKNSAEGLDDKLLTRQSDQSYALVQFDVSGISAPVLSAILRLEWHVSSVLNQGVEVRRFNLAWNDNVATVFKLTDASGVAVHPVNLPATAAFNELQIYAG